MLKEYSTKKMYLSSFIAIFSVYLGRYRPDDFADSMQFLVERSFNFLSAFYFSLSTSQLC